MRLTFLTMMVLSSSALVLTKSEALLEIIEGIGPLIQCQGPSNSTMEELKALQGSWLAIQYNISPR